MAAVEGPTSDSRRACHLTWAPTAIEHARIVNKIPTSTGRRDARRNAGLGTFGGVFTPSILTILGIILFRRLGFIVGSGGLAQALVILGLATLISVLTSISLSAIATNRKVKGGGDYYLISRTLGVEYGGALGLILFAAQAVSVGFYCVGFGEGIASLVGGAEWVTRASACLAAVGLLGLAYSGANLATRFQYVIMLLLIAALASFFAGAQFTWDIAILRQGWRGVGDGSSFWVIFAILFPAVTGFTQGVSMSGDLKDPGRSLPVGTFAAGRSFDGRLYRRDVRPGCLNSPDRPRVRLRQPAAHRTRSVARRSRGAVRNTLIRLSLVPGRPADFAGTGEGPPVQAVDLFSAGVGPTANPRRAVVLTSAIALTTIVTGDLNAIAELVSMFFLVSYGLLNYATYVEAVAASPSFRPRFRFFNAKASLAGTALCGLVMLMINPMASAVALGILGALYHFPRWTAADVTWHDSRRAYRFKRVKDGLQELSVEPQSSTDWQPHVLVFTETAERRARLLRAAGWMTGGSGILTAVQLVEGDGASLSVRQARDEAEEQLRCELQEQQLDAYPLVVAAPDLRVGASTLLQSWGVGPIRSNTVMLNWYESQSAETLPTLSLWYARILQRAARLGQHVVVLDASDNDWRLLEAANPRGRRIDVWWFGGDSSRLALLFAYLMTRDDDWDEATIRVLAPSPPDAAQKTDGSLRRRLDELRIDADVRVR